MTTVQHGSVTITSSDTEAQINAAYADTPGETTPDTRADIIPDETPVDPSELSGKAPETPKPDETTERGPDGKFVKRSKHDASADDAPRIRDLTYKLRQAERERDEARVQLARPAAAPIKPADSTPAGKSSYAEAVKRYAADPTYPKFEDFDGNWDNWKAAESLFLADQRYNERQAADRTAQQQQSTQHAKQRVREAGEAQYADWSTVVAAPAVAQLDIPDPLFKAFHDAPLGHELVYAVASHPEQAAALFQAGLPAGLFEAIGVADNGPDLLQHLLTHPDEARALALKHPAQALLSLGAIGRSSPAPSGSGESPRAISRAKPPMKPVGSSPSAPDSQSIETLPFGPEYIRRMNALERQKREDSRGA